MKVESITGQLRKSMTNSRKPRFIISLENSFNPVLFKNDPLPSTRTHTVRFAVPTRMDEGAVTVSMSDTQAAAGRKKFHRGISSRGTTG